MNKVKTFSSSQSSLYLSLNLFHILRKKSENVKFLLKGRLFWWQVLSVSVLICLGITNASFKTRSKLKHSSNCNPLHHATLQFHPHKLPTNYQAHVSKFISFSYYLSPTERGCMSSCAHFQYVKFRIQSQQQHLQVFGLDT